jgi:hypothetical protein
LTCMRLVNIGKDRSTTLQALHTSSPHEASYLKRSDCWDQVFPYIPFTDTDYLRRRRVRFDPTIGNPIKVTHSNLREIVHEIVHDIPFTDQMTHKDRPVKTSVLNHCIPSILRRHGTKFGRCLTIA